jgi:hypothetical protein
MEKSIQESKNKKENKESQSQQAAGYSLSLKLENESRTKVAGITPSLSNKDNKKMDESKKIRWRKGINWMVVVYSIIGLACIALSFTVDWMFLIGTVICIFLNQRELNKKT